MSALPADSTSLDSIRRSLGDRYSLERELGRGGMGAVYLARDLRLDRLVALKVLPPEFASQSALRDRFLRETRTAASFSHPNIVPVYAVEESPELLAYAMGYIEGETLTQRVARGGPLPVRELVRLIQDVGYALAYAHGRGVVHRDIKPDNVMLERATGRALVLDFGISRSMAAAAAPGSSLTRVGEVVGTPEYMSPEQASGDVVDGRSDLYALGLTAHFAATGTTAVTGDSAQRIFVRQLTERIPSIAERRPDLPAALAAAIDRCVQKEPGERFEFAEALVEELDAAQLAEPEIPLPLRLFAGELSSLSVAVIGISIVSFLMVRSQLAANMSQLDVLLPVAGLLAILITRALTTTSETRRLAMAGYSPADVAEGRSRVMAERAARRAELRADPDTRRRRSATIKWGAAMLVVAIVLARVALASRTRLGPTHYQTPFWGIVLIFSAFGMLGTSLVLLLKSPFRMPPAERLYRIVWLGPIGRAFVWLGMRGVAVSGAATARVRTAPRSGATRPRLESVAPAGLPASPIPLPARQLPAPMLAQRVATPIPETIAALEARLMELERWRQEHGQ